MWSSVSLTTSTPRLPLSRLNHAACTLSVYASQPGSPPDHATLDSGWWPALTGQDSHLLGRIEGFRHVYPSTWLPPSPSFAWRNKDSVVPWGFCEMAVLHRCDGRRFLDSARGRHSSADESTGRPNPYLAKGPGRRGAAMPPAYPAGKGSAGRMAASGQLPAAIRPFARFRSVADIVLIMLGMKRSANSVCRANFVPACPHHCALREFLFRACDCQGSAGLPRDWPVRPSEAPLCTARRSARCRACVNVGPCHSGYGCRLVGRQQQGWIVASMHDQVCCGSRHGKVVEVFIGEHSPVGEAGIFQSVSSCGRFPARLRRLSSSSGRFDLPVRRARGRCSPPTSPRKASPQRVWRPSRRLRTIGWRIPGRAGM